MLPAVLNFCALFGEDCDLMITRTMVQLVLFGLAGMQLWPELAYPNVIDSLQDPCVREAL